MKFPGVCRASAGPKLLEAAQYTPSGIPDARIWGRTGNGTPCMLEPVHCRDGIGAASDSSFANPAKTPEEGVARRETPFLHRSAISNHWHVVGMVALSQLVGTRPSLAASRRCPRQRRELFDDGGLSARPASSHPQQLPGGLMCYLDPIHRQIALPQCVALVANGERS